MSHLPLTRPEPFTEIPATSGMEPLFPDLVMPVKPEAGQRPVEIIVIFPGSEDRVQPYLVCAEAEAGFDVLMLLKACRGLGRFEINLRPYEG